jgi:pimeloyl-ACP methyl ester carboxylesterase
MLRFWTVLAAATCSLGLSACSQSQPAASTPEKAMTTPRADDDCEKFRQSLPADWQQGFLQVAENPAEPDGNKIEIFYYAKLNPNSIPTVYFNGGPGSSSHGDYALLTRRQSLFDPDKAISMIFIDQRGNGCSQSYPQGSDPVTLQRLRFYGSRGIVADAEAVRTHLLGQARWIAAGQSYGGYIVHRYVTLHPEALTAAISQQDVLTSDGYFRFKTRIASQARVLQEYFTQYPDDRDRLAHLRNYLIPSKCFASKTGKMHRCGYAVLNPLTNFLGFTDNWLLIHQWVGIMAPGGIPSDPGLARFLAVYAFSAQANPENNKDWAGSVINYVDRNVPPLDSAHCEKIRTDLATVGIDLNQVFINECMVTLQNPPLKPADPATWQKNLAQDPLTIADFARVLHDQALPFYLYSGEQDTYVPVAEFSEELAAIGGFANFHYTDYPDTGHDGSYEEPQTWFDWVALSRH